MIRWGRKWQRPRGVIRFASRDGDRIPDRVRLQALATIRRARSQAAQNDGSGSL